MDHVGEKIYVVDVRGCKIDILELDARYRSVALGPELFRPLDVKLDPYERFLFVLDGNRVLRTRMDGSSTLVLARGRISSLHGISVDVTRKRVYWVGIDMIITSCGYSGEDVQTKNATISSYTKFAVMNDTVYQAADFIHGYKSDCEDPEPGQPRKSIYESNPMPTIRILHSSLQKKVVNNPCKMENGRCQHMCILMNSGGEFRCACNVGWKLDDTLMNCTRVTEFMIYEQSVLRSYEIENCNSGFCEVYLPMSGDKKSAFQSFDYHSGNNNVYHILRSSLEYDTIYKVRLNESVPKIMSVGKSEEYESLSVDWMAGNLYYVDPSMRTVSVIGLKNESLRAVLMKNLSSPRNVMVHPDRGLVYFLQSLNDTFYFSRANSDGTNLTVFDHMKLIRFRGYAIDYVEDRIYWYSWFSECIWHSNLEIEDARNVTSRLTKNVLSISFYKKWMYVATLMNDGLWRIDKKTGEEEELMVEDSSNRIGGVKIFSSEVQKVNKNHPCFVNNGDCSELCFGLFKSDDGSWSKVCVDSDKKSSQNKSEDSPQRLICSRDSKILNMSSKSQH